MTTNNDYLSDIANEPRDSGKTNNQLLEQIASGGGGGGGSADKTYSVGSQSGNYDIPTDATTVVYLDVQEVGITLPVPTANRSIRLIYLYGEPTTLNGSFIPSLTVEAYSCYEVLAYQSDTETLSWVAINLGVIPLS